MRGWTNRERADAPANQGRSRRPGSPSVTSRTYARMVNNNQGQTKPERKERYPSLGDGHARPGHAIANQLAAFPLFSFEFACSRPSMASSPPLSCVFFYYYFGARTAREGWLNRGKVFFARLEFPRCLWCIPPSSLVSRLCGAYMPARASQRAVHQGWTRPNSHTHGASSHVVSLGVATWREGKVKKVRGVHFASPG